MRKIILLLVLCLLSGAVVINSQSRKKSHWKSKTTKTSHPKSNQTFTVNGVSFTMIYVEGGTFTMGATPEQLIGLKEEEIKELKSTCPSEKKRVSSFYIGQTEVTQELWQAVMGTNASNVKGTNFPVNDPDLNGGYFDDFITKLNKLTGKRFRIPTYEEWEYAARGGNKSRHYQYSGSNNPEDVGWKEDEGIHKVATKKPNELGIYDMTGNVFEAVDTSNDFDIWRIGYPVCSFYWNDFEMWNQGYRLAL